ncbi:MAG: hypothetical protein ACREMF_03105, partial [Gemmatimonadales bacterium]
LRSALGNLPPETLVPARWVLEQLDASPAPAEELRDLTIEDVAAQFGRRPSTVRGWLERNLLRGYRLNGKALSRVERAMRRGESPRSPSAVGSANDDVENARLSAELRASIAAGNRRNLAWARALSEPDLRWLLDHDHRRALHEAGHLVIGARRNVRWTRATIVREVCTIPGALGECSEMGASFRPLPSRT